MLKWDDKVNPLSMDDIEDVVKEEKKLESQKLTPKQWWSVFNDYMKSGDESLLNKLANSSYPTFNALIGGLAFDFSRRCEFNKMYNHVSQHSILHNRKELLRLMKQLHDEGGFVYLPKKDYTEIETTYKRKYPWLNSQELELLTKLKPLDKSVTKTKVKKQKLSSKPTKPQETSMNDIVKKLYDIYNDKTYCANCPHNGQPTAPFDIRYADRPVNMLILGEAPHTEEVKPENQKPFVGESGQKLRKHILNELPDSINYVIWNSSMCKVLPNKQNLKKAIHCCRNKLLQVIELLQPKVIVPLGSTAYYTLFQKDVAMSKVNGILQTLSYNGKDYNVIPTYHPAYLVYNANNEAILDSMKYAFVQAQLCIEQNITPSTSTTTTVSTVKNKPQFFDKHIIENKLMLLDIQEYEDQLVYIFKDQNNKRHIEIKHFDGTSPIFYYYVPKENRITKPFYRMDECDIVVCNTLDEYKNAKYSKIGLHSDIYMSTRHAIDYYQLAKQHNIEQNYSIHIGFVDIEVTPEDRKSFPDQAHASDPITAITYANNNDNILHTWILVDPANHSQEAIYEVSQLDHCYVYTDETRMMIDFLKHVYNDDPDVIAGWNVFFDLNYICKRANRLNIKNWRNYLSPIGRVTVESSKSYVHIGGRIVSDMLQNYKQFSYGTKDSYALQAIATFELGYGKVEFEGTYFSLYDDIVKFAKYNKQDVQLLIDLENKLKHITFMDELRQLLQGTWLSLVSTSATCDCMLVSYLENRNLVTKPKSYQNVQTQFKGAFVYTPQPGIRKWVFDLDYSSLYPNIIRTFNIGLDTFAAVISEKDAEAIIFDKYTKSHINIILDPLFNDKETTMSIEEFKKNLQIKWLLTPCGSIFLRQSQKRGILYDLMTMLLEERAKAKKLKAKYKAEKKTDLVERYHNVQWKYKIIANSFYGYLGFQHSRMYDRRVAAAITSVGRYVAKSGIISASKIISKYASTKTNFDLRNLYLSDTMTVPHVVYSDSVHKSSMIRYIQDTYMYHEPIEDMFNRFKDNCTIRMDGKEEIDVSNEKLLTHAVDMITQRIKLSPVKKIIRHKVRKRLYRVKTKSGKSVILTEDHSAIKYENDKLQVVKTKELKIDDKVITLDSITSITEIEDLGYTEDYVYDLEVDNTHTFFANDILVHNTDSIISSLEHINQEITDDFIKHELPKIEQAIDETTRQTMISMFNLEECYFKLKVEWIAYKMLQLVAKKKYAFMEYPSKKIEIVGMESKRSDQPPILRKWLINFIEYILTHENITRNDIANYIKKYADEYTKILSSRTIEAGKPMTANFNNLNLPQGRAAKNWNELEYEYFTNSVKGYYFNLKGVDTTKRPELAGKKIKDILVPFEAGKLPEYYIIDVNEMVTKYWTKKALAIVNDIAPGIANIIDKTINNRAIGIATW